MAVEVTTLSTAHDLTHVMTDWGDRVQPALADSGALEATGWLALSGAMTGMLASSTRWSTLGQWADASAELTTRMVGGDLADVAGRYQIVQRIVAIDLHETGTPSGPYMNATRYSTAAPPVGLEHAGDLAVANGANGIRIMSILSGGDMTGHIVGVMFLDSFDALPELLASITNDDQFVANAQAMGAQLQSRTLFRRM